MKIRAVILILCMLLLVSCTEAVEFTDTEDDYYGITEDIEESYYDIDEYEDEEYEDEEYEETYLINVSSKKIHYMHCGTGQRTKEKNRDYFKGDVSYLLGKGYTTCKNCFE